MVVDTKSLFCQRLTLCCRDDGIGHHVQTPGFVQYGYRALYKLAIPALGDQAVLEPTGRSTQDKEILDRCDAITDRGGSWWCGPDPSDG